MCFLNNITLRNKRTFTSKVRFVTVFNLLCTCTAKLIDIYFSHLAPSNLHESNNNDC